MLKKIIGGISSEAVGKIAETTGKAVDAYAEGKRLEHEKELEAQKIQEEKRTTRRPILTVLIAVCTIALLIVWVRPADILAGKLFASIFLIPLIIYCIKKL